MTRTVEAEEDSDSSPAAAQSESIGSSLPPEALSVPRDLASSYLHTKKVAAYFIGRQIGEGSFARVAEAMHSTTGELVAVKIVDKEKATSDPYVCRNLRREGRILQKIRHPNVLQLLEVLETEHAYYLVSELCTGGDLLSFVMHRRRLDEPTARRFLKQILGAVQYIHKLGIMHRDLKIENILLTSESKLKIIDFGLSTLIKSVRGIDGSVLQQLCKTQCGSPAYAAPEVLARQPYGTAADVWSIGVNMFAMLTGCLPFSTKPYSIRALHQKMVAGEMNPLPKELSASGRDLLLKLLNPDPQKRIGIAEALRHPWLQGCGCEQPIPGKPQAADLRQDALQRCAATLAISVEEATQKVLQNIPSPCLATYTLLVARARRYCAQNQLEFASVAMAADPLGDGDSASSIDADSCSSSCCGSVSSRAASDTAALRPDSKLLKDRPSLRQTNGAGTQRLQRQHPQQQQKQQKQQKQTQFCSVLDLRVTRDRTTMFGKQQLPHIHPSRRQDSGRRGSVSRRRVSDVRPANSQPPTRATDSAAATGE